MNKRSLAIQYLLMTNAIEYYLTLSAKWESDYASHDWSQPHFEQGRISGVPQGLKLCQQYCKWCGTLYDDNRSVTCPGMPAHLLTVL